MKYWILVVVLLLPAALLAQALPMKVWNAQLSVPFGTADGFLVTAQDQLLFVNRSDPDASFGVARQDIEDIHVDNQVVALTVERPILGRTEFTFRLSDPTAVDTLTTWQASGPAAIPSQPAPLSLVQSYRVQHNHFIGECTGQLIITENSISYESTDKLAHSRQWEMSGIQEINLKNPYLLVINPFSGDKYEFKLLQKGMSQQQFQALVARIGEARAAN